MARHATDTCAARGGGVGLGRSPLPNYNRTMRLICRFEDWDGTAGLCTSLRDSIQLTVVHLACGKHTAAACFCKTAMRRGCAPRSRKVDVLQEPFSFLSAVQGFHVGGFARPGCQPSLPPRAFTGPSFLVLWRARRAYRNLDTPAVRPQLTRPRAVREWETRLSGVLLTENILPQKRAYKINP